MSQTTRWSIVALLFPDTRRDSLDEGGLRATHSSGGEVKWDGENRVVPREEEVAARGIARERSSPQDRAALPGCGVDDLNIAFLVVSSVILTAE